MSIDKWLIESESKEIREKKEEIFRKLPQKEVKKLKKKSIKKIVKTDIHKESEIPDSSTSFLDMVLKFKNWLDERTYLKGDIDKIIIKVQNLNKSIEVLNKMNKKLSSQYYLDTLKNLYKQIPPSFLDEKTRIALNKKCRGATRTSSDNYYLRKLKNTIKEKLNEAKYYEILRNILEN